MNKNNNSNEMRITPQWENIKNEIIDLYNGLAYDLANWQRYKTPKLADKWLTSLLGIYNHQRSKIKRTGKYNNLINNMDNYTLYEANLKLGVLVKCSYDILDYIVETGIFDVEQEKQKTYTPDQAIKEMFR